MAAPYIGKFGILLRLKDAKKPEAHIHRVSGSFFVACELGCRRGAVGIKCALQLLSDRRSGRGLDRRTLHQVHQADRRAKSQSQARSADVRQSSRVPSRSLHGPVLQTPSLHDPASLCAASPGVRPDASCPPRNRRWSSPPPSSFPAAQPPHPPRPHCGPPSNQRASSSSRIGITIISGYITLSL